MPVITFGKFFETLDLMESPSGAITISAAGPKSRDEAVKEICVWVFQRNGDDDAAATEMTTVAEGREAFTQSAQKWTLQVKKIESKIPFEEGPAIAVAIALIDGPTDGRKKAEKVLQWSQSIDLVAEQPTSKRPQRSRRRTARTTTATRTSRPRR